MGVIFNNMKKFDYLNITISITLILLIGLSVGYSVGYYHSAKNCFPEIKFTDEINQGIATIKLMEIKNGKLVGSVSGRDARIVYSPNDIIELKKGEKFEIPISQIQLKSYYQAGAIPENAQFIASKEGKYYYSIFDKQAFNISVKNRLYFPNAKEAEKMGYVKK